MVFQQQHFPRIEHIRDLQPFVSDLSEIRFFEQSNQTIIACYLVAKEDTFNTPHARECRGITFDAVSGKIICRPLHKFFNINERPDTHYEVLPKVDRIVRMMDKMDGSMLSPALVQGQIDFKTKKSFESDVAQSAKRWVFDPKRKQYVEFCLSLLHAGLTPIFEYVSPSARIVLIYETEMMTLLHVRDQITGAYLALDDPFLKDLIARYDIPCVQSVSSERFTTLMDDLKVLELIEGFVVQYDDGHMVKAKTEWYLKLHRSVTFLRERDVAELVVLEKIDDLKSAIAEIQGQMAHILEIEKDVVKRLTEIEDTVDTIYEEIKDLDRKTVAIRYLNHPYFSLIMTRYAKKEVDYQGFFLRHLLTVHYTLNTIKTNATNIVEE
jgi:RNA ligase